MSYLVKILAVIAATWLAVGGCAYVALVVWDRTHQPFLPPAKLAPHASAGNLSR